MPVSAEGRAEHQKRTQTVTTLWPFGFVSGVLLDSLEKKTRREPVHAALVHIQKRGKSSFVIYETVVFSFFHKKSSFSEEGEKLLCNLSTVIFDIVAFPFRFPDVQKRGKSSCVIYRPVIIPFP